MGGWPFFPGSFSLQGPTLENPTIKVSFSFQLCRSQSFKLLLFLRQLASPFYFKPQVNSLNMLAPSAFFFLALTASASASPLSVVQPDLSSGSSISSVVPPATLPVPMIPVLPATSAASATTVITAPDELAMNDSKSSSSPPALTPSSVISSVIPDTEKTFQIIPNPGKDIPLPSISLENMNSTLPVNLILDHDSLPTLEAPVLFPSMNSPLLESNSSHPNSSTSISFTKLNFTSIGNKLGELSHVAFNATSHSTLGAWNVMNHTAFSIGDFGIRAFNSSESMAKHALNSTSGFTSKQLKEMNTRRKIISGKISHFLKDLSTVNAEAEELKKFENSTQTSVIPAA